MILIISAELMLDLNFLPLEFDQQGNIFMFKCYV